MKNSIQSKIAGACLLAVPLALAACGDDADESVEQAETTRTDVDETQFVMMPIELTPTQQQMRDALDEDAYTIEVTRYMDDDNSTATSAGRTDPASDDGESVAGSIAQGSSSEAITEFDFSTIDRNDDNRLSVAEYAIYALKDANPMKQKNKDDEKSPYFTAQQLNWAADSFFFYDDDSDSWLSESEFSDAVQANVRAQDSSG